MNALAGHRSNLRLRPQRITATLMIRDLGDYVEAAPRADRIIVFAANSAWNILNFRMNLVRAVSAEGLTPVALVPPGEGEAELRKAGLAVHTIPMSSDDTSPLSGFMLVVRYVQALRRIRPAAFLGFTPKPN